VWPCPSDDSGDAHSGTMGVATVADICGGVARFTRENVSFLRLGTVLGVGNGDAV
jgi:hypothetical protein